MFHRLSRRLDMTGRAVSSLVATRPGDVVGDRFQIERHVGAGGMGAIYRARDQQDDRLVALKLVNALDAQSIERFEREAKALVDLSHPSIVEYRAHGRMNDTTLYLAMEWLQRAEPPP